MSERAARVRAACLAEFKYRLGTEWSEEWAEWAELAKPGRASMVNEREATRIVTALRAALTEALRFLGRRDVIDPGAARISGLGPNARLLNSLARTISDTAAQISGAKASPKRNEGDGRAKLVRIFTDQTVLDRLGIARPLSTRELAIVSILSGNTPRMGARRPKAPPETMVWAPPVSHKNPTVLGVLRAEEKAIRLAVRRAPGRATKVPVG